MISKISKLFRFSWEYWNDFLITMKHNTYSPFEDKNTRLYYRIIIVAHTIEKGLSLADPRKLFGREKIQSILAMSREYDRSHSSFPLEMVVGALTDYIKFHRDHGVADPFIDEIETVLRNDPVFTGIEPNGGFKRTEELRMISGEESEASVRFLESRFSCRHYRSQVIPDELIERLVGTAQLCPSQCNRQSAKVHCFKDKSKIVELLQLQGGSSGFLDSVYNLFVVTSEVTAWGGYGQRNQAYVDSGLFAQQLMLACHANGIGFCPLNLAVDNATEKKIKEAAGIHPRERLCMMISFGYYGDGNLKAARSPRIPLNSVLRLH